MCLQSAPCFVYIAQNENEVVGEAEKSPIKFHALWRSISIFAEETKCMFKYNTPIGEKGLSLQSIYSFQCVTVSIYGSWRKNDNFLMACQN